MGSNENTNESWDKIDKYLSQLKVMDTAYQSNVFGELMPLFKDEDGNVRE